MRFFRKTGRGLAVTAAILAAIGLTTVPQPAEAGGGWGGGGIGPGAAVGIGLGAFALGSVLANPYYYNPYYYNPYGNYGYYPPTSGLLSTGGVLSVSAELLERLLSILLRLLGSGRTARPRPTSRSADFCSPIE